MSRNKTQTNVLSDEQLLKILDESENENSLSELKTESSEDNSKISSEVDVPVNIKNNRPVVIEDKWLNCSKKIQPIIFSP
ncbi:Hypothetical protein CINCED_3A014041 [Cinara cedri]|uniref:Uncharacterized protein n=1 Tax=Cinara cedri TaxID=506608 RepID=A0A5E4MY98_9HEMI|nr:Hypothetical protein CINCED_3A014041 [Cinara cedri]